MPLNATAMTANANYLQGVLLYAQLHSGMAGPNGTDNVTPSPRQLVSWGQVTGLGNFGLQSQIAFSGGPASGAVYSVTLWSSDQGGTYYGEAPLTGDANYNGAGEYFVTALDVTGVVEV